MGIRTDRVGRAVVALIVITAGMAACDPPPPPVVVVVDATGADGDAAPGDGACATADGDCTLQAAVDEASASAIDRIELPAGWVIPAPVTYVVDPVRPILTISTTVTGSPATVLGSFATLEHETDQSATSLVLSDLELTGSRVGAVQVGWATTVLLQRTTISGRGGPAIDVRGSAPGTGPVLILVDSTIEDTSGAASAVLGADDWWVTVIRSTIAGNAGPVAMLHWDSTITVIDSEIVHNGGGISHISGPITVRGSLLADNGFVAIDAVDGGSLTIEDSTVTGSVVAVSASYATVDVERSTIVGNDIGVSTWGSGTRITASTLANGVDLEANRTSISWVGGSILAGETGCTAGTWDQIISVGSNVASDTSCGFTGASDQQGVDPLLGPLADNGGPTPTALPGAGSLAIDAIPGGTPVLCEAGVVDQRGISRPQGTACDAGAVEQ